MSFNDILRSKSQWQVGAQRTMTRKVSLESLSQRNCLQIPGFLHKNLSPAKASGAHRASPASLASVAWPFLGGMTDRSDPRKGRGMAPG